MKYLLLALLLISNTAFAENFSGKVEKIDPTTLKIVRSEEATYNITDLIAKRDYLVSEKAQSDASFDLRINELDARISEAKALGVE